MRLSVELPKPRNRDKPAVGRNLEALSCKQLFRPLGERTNNPLLAVRWTGSQMADGRPKTLKESPHRTPPCANPSRRPAADDFYRLRASAYSQ